MRQSPTPPPPPPQEGKGLGVFMGRGKMRYVVVKKSLLMLDEARLDFILHGLA